MLHAARTSVHHRAARAPDTARPSCSCAVWPPPSPGAGRPAHQPHGFRFAARTFPIGRDRPPRHPLMNTTTWRIAALMLAAPRRGTAGAGGRAWTLARSGNRSSGSSISHSKRAWPHLRAGSARDTTAPCRSAAVGSAGRLSMSGPPQATSRPGGQPTRVHDGDQVDFDDPAQVSSSDCSAIGPSSQIPRC
jgi:hypothetical protein